MTNSSVNANKTIRRARTAYNFFFHIHRNSIKERIERETGKRPTYTQLAKLVAAGWKACDPAEKAHFKELAARDKRRYALEFIKSRTEEENENQEQEIEGSNMATVQGNTTERHSNFGVNQEPVENVQPVLNLPRAPVNMENHEQCPVATTTWSQECAPPAPVNLQEGLAQLLRTPQVSNILAGILLGVQQQVSRDAADFNPIQVSDFATETNFDNDVVRHLEQVFGVFNN